MIVTKGNGAAFDDVNNKLAEIHTQARTGSDKKERVVKYASHARFKQFWLTVFAHRTFKALICQDKFKYGDAAFVETQTSSELQQMVNNHISNTL